MSLCIKQCGNIKLRVLLEKSPSGTLKMVKKAYENSAMNKTVVYKWHEVSTTFAHLKLTFGLSGLPLPQQMTMFNVLDNLCVQTDEQPSVLLLPNLVFHECSQHSS